MMAMIGRDPTLYGEHSGRRGGATTASEAGVSWLDLKRHGRWASDSAPQRYIEQTDKNANRVAAALAKPPPSTSRQHEYKTARQELQQQRRAAQTSATGPTRQVWTESQRWAAEQRRAYAAGSESAAAETRNAPAAASAIATTRKTSKIAGTAATSRQPSANATTRQTLTISGSQPSTSRETGASKTAAPVVASRQPPSHATSIATTNATSVATTRQTLTIPSSQPQSCRDPGRVGTQAKRRLVFTQHPHTVRQWACPQPAEAGTTTFVNRNNNNTRFVAPRRTDNDLPADVLFSIFNEEFTSEPNNKKAKKE